MGPLLSNPEQTTLDHPATIDPHIQEMEEQFSRERLLARLRLLWNERRFLVRCVLIGLIVATLTAFLIPKQFESTAQLMPPESQSSSSVALLAGMSAMSAPGGGGQLGMLAGDLLGIKSTGALFVGVLRSRTVEDRIVDRFDLKKVYGLSLQIKAREKLAERTAVTEDRKSGIITIMVTDHDPKRAAAIASAYVEELNTLIEHVSTSSARREHAFLEERLSAVKMDLEAAEKDFSQFASSKGAIDITAQGKAMVEAAATLEGELIAAQSEMEGLKQIYTDRNVRVRSTQARINELSQQLRRLGGKSSSTAENGDDPAADAPYPTLRQLPILGVPYADKLRRLKIQEAVFETLTKQNELAKVQEAKEVPSVKELDVPTVPEHKSYPPRLVIVILGMLCASVVGMVWVLGQARWQEMDPQDPGKVLVQDVFHTFAARIPWISRNGTSGESPEVDVKDEGEDRPSAKGASAGN
jgi:uncharacterized protein involved in exopolysaccharide biosynthesis